MLPAHDNCLVALAIPRRVQEALRACVPWISGFLRASAAIPTIRQQVLPVVDVTRATWCSTHASAEPSPSKPGLPQLASTQWPSALDPVPGEGTRKVEKGGFKRTVTSGAD